MCVYRTGNVLEEHLFQIRYFFSVIDKNTLRYLRYVHVYRRNKYPVTHRVVMRVPVIM